jgi:hypothetical protein
MAEQALQYQPAVAVVVAIQVLAVAAAQALAAQVAAVD